MTHPLLKHRTERENAIRRMAREAYQNEGTLEIDDNAMVSEVAISDGGSNGAYVEAWVWVDFTGTPMSKFKEK